jgi:agmatine deiminase
MPAETGYRMPAEWERHAATWIAWPHHRDDWPGKFESIPWVYAEIVRHLARHEKVEIIVNHKAAEQNSQKVLRQANALSNSVRFHRWPTDRVWTRDYGPIFVKRRSSDRQSSGRQSSERKPAERQSASRALMATNWRFNAWAKYPNWKKDNAIADQVARTLRVPQMMPEYEVSGRKKAIVLEGGSIDVNGRGMLLTTEECLLSKVQQRNRGLTREMLEKTFERYLGIKKVIWLGRGIVGDDTHGHVDDIARFVAPDTVAVAVERDSRDPNYEPLQQNLRRLRSATDQNGKRLRIVELPMPAAISFQGRRLPASYANFYIANGLLLVPTFNDKNDRVALDILAEVFPDREVVGIYCGDLIWGFGAIHCMTQQQPVS